MTERNLNIYYAHHQRKYSTKIEEYELDLIKEYFPNATIFNPSADLNVEGKSEDEIMNIYLNQIKISDMVIFSSMDGLVGIGVFKEVTHVFRSSCHCWDCHSTWHRNYSCYCSYDSDNLNGKRC